MAEPHDAKPSGHQARRSLPLSRKLLFSAITLLLSFGMVELVLVLAQVQPRLQEEDPYVGFVSDVSLFVEETAPDGTTRWVTGPNKRGYFNYQSFAAEKGEDTIRIFCLGGSTTYGRPYDDTTSFAGWLRELLPVADPTRRWEVINAGGISYASYRVARVLEELIDYQPDLFVIYTGHNEFLEERTYGELRDTPQWVKRANTLLSRTRTGTALAALVDRVRRRDPGDSERRSFLSREVQAKLDHSAGLELYERDDSLRDGIVAHYRESLERMVRRAQGVGAKVLLVTPASNLGDCTPFKSQATDGIDARAQEQASTRLVAARSYAQAESWNEALAELEIARGLDPRNADVQFERGRALLALDRGEEARVAFELARDEDVCPLRALGVLLEAAREVAADTGVLHVDFDAFVRDWSQQHLGSPVAGERLFLDHVHPTIEGHRLLALQILGTMVEARLVRPAATWSDDAVAEVAARVEASIDADAHARALSNLALTLSWAGKVEESRRLAFRALESGVQDANILMMAARHQALQGEGDEALATFRSALKAEPGSPVVHSQLGFLLAGRGELEAAASHFFLASLLWADNENYHQQLGFIMTQRGRTEVALTSLREAARLAPHDVDLRTRVAGLESRLGARAAQLTQPELDVSRYDTGYPHTIAQTQPGPSGPVLHGVWTEWFDGGGLKRYVDYVNGRPDGVEVTWSEDGTVVARTEHAGSR